MSFPQYQTKATFFFFFWSRIYKPLPITSRVLLELSRERNQCRNIIPLRNVKWQQVGPSTVCPMLNIKWCTTNLQWVLCMNSLLGCLFVISFLVQKNSSFLKHSSFFFLHFFFNFFFFQHKLMKKLSDSAANVIIGGTCFIIYDSMVIITPSQLLSMPHTLHY